jgi:hypothetical protein
MIRFRHAVAPALFVLAACQASAALACECHPIVLNGQLSTADFTGGVGDRSGGDGYGGGGQAFVFAPARSGAAAFAFSSAFAKASAHAGAGMSHSGGHGGYGGGGHR